MREGGGPVDGGDGTGGGQGCCTGWRTGLWRGETDREADGAAAEDAGGGGRDETGLPAAGREAGPGLLPRASFNRGRRERSEASRPNPFVEPKGSGDVLFEPKGSGSGRQAGLRRGGSGA